MCSCADAYHFRIGSELYFKILFDEDEYEELDAELSGVDPLHFVDKKPYNERLKEAQEKTGLHEAQKETADIKLSG